MRNFFQKLMYGRYGMDQLNVTIMWSYVILTVLFWFVRWRILYWLTLVLFFVWVFRAMSRNTWQRQKENAKFTAMLHSINMKYHFQLRKIKEWRTCRYRKCPHCQSVLRLPRKRGKHTVCCPRCHQDFSVNIRF
ncbi:MAG: hypothetical protein ACI4PM_07920 [Butyricicoccus sp.]